MTKKHYDETRKTYTIAEVKQLLGVGTNAAYNAVHRGDIPVIKIGKRLLVSKAALDRILEAE
jgi:excisionase family DNA binding protein